jgi:hypothetical protein
VLIARLLFGCSSLLLLANCAGQPDLSQYSLTGPRAAQEFAPSERSPKTLAQLSERPHPAKTHTPQPTAPVQSADLTSSVAPSRSPPAVESSRPSVEPVRSSIAPTPVSMAPLSYVEQLAKDDKEDQLLAVKTKICRGC